MLSVARIVYSARAKCEQRPVPTRVFRDRGCGHSQHPVRPTERFQRDEVLIPLPGLKRRGRRAFSDGDRLTGTVGDFAQTLKMDLAEAMMMFPDKVADAQKLYLSLYEAAPDDAMAPRALYNAAFAAMQLGQSKVSSDLADQFLKKYDGSPLTSDIRYIIAESKLMNGAHAEAAEGYQRLLDDPASEKNPQRPLWVLRAGMATYLAGKHDDAIPISHQPELKACAVRLRRLPEAAR